MNTELSNEAQELGAVVHEQIEDAGGVAVLRAAVADPGARAAAGELLDRIGVWDLVPRNDQLEFEAAAAVARSAGAFAFPYPVVERLGRLGGSDATTLVSNRGPRLAMHLDLPLQWSATDLRGSGYVVRPTSAILDGAELAPFGVEVEAEPNGTADPLGTAVLVTLHSWWLLGLLESALADTIRYVGEREQFGRRLSRFQSVGFTVADMELATRGFEELAKYTIWSVARGGESALADAIALRVASQTSADTVLRGAHQLHGAMGFTDEVDVSWLSRASQGVRRLPDGAHRTAELLTELLGTTGLEPLGGGAPAAALFAH